MSEHPFLSNLMSAVSAADDYRARAEILINENLRNRELLEALESTEFGMECLAGAHMYLQSGLDSFFSFRLLALPDGIPDRTRKSEIRFQITNNGCATLLRQSLECLAKAHSLLENATVESVNARGFAIAWENSRQRLKFERAVATDALNSQIQLHENLRLKGIQERYLIFSEERNKFILQYPLLDTTSLLRGITSPLELPKEVLERLGKGFENAEWTYHWLSGLSHGLSWVHTFKPLEKDEEYSLQHVYPNSEKFAHIAVYVLKVAQLVFAELEGKFESRLNSRDTETQ